MKKGIIMQIDDTYLTLLTPEGEFLKARKQEQPYSIGEEIHFFPAGGEKTSKSFWTGKIILRKPVWIGAFALLIFLGSFIPMYQNSKAYAYMSIDVNPSLELGINKKMQVVELTAYNSEGKKVISQLMNWKDEDVSTVTEDILRKIKKDGFLKDNKRIIISTVRTHQSNQEVEEQLQKNIKEIEASVNAQHLQLTLLTGTEKDLQKAHQLGITAGKFQSENIQKTKAVVPPSGQKQEEKKEVIPPKKAPIVPPGQLKKQAENSSNNAVEKKVQTENQNGGKGHSIPPGQQKKMDENNFQYNHGQDKKQFWQTQKYNSKPKPNENKQESYNTNHKPKQNENKEERHNTNHKHN